ncbi:fyve and coiled-coil domain-containing protein 1 [Plakobranchus ocellatus]|uniref:RUN and FYVE domain-containing protein 4 n=1 Tax=Plakobranchus ocellatus TaxID=259542 RepID=A0AAV4A2D3_9GAST|nr:fyve and coiled-coil domain-containing protein 1 [Plakobranchus ocellatus]
MAGISAYPGGLRAQNATAIPSPASLPMQKKILENVLECIVQLKADFFENHQPITDDSIVLQRFCAKFEHFLQIGMKEKVSLLGRKKDYWDYFLDCLGSSKGINDGIKYVKSLGEHKTSLGRGRAFIRFCLVHQRLADTMQQCVVNEKTLDWFNPGTLMTNQKECQHLISCLYDLNSLHFDLSPRGYDLDASWPAFANRKHAGSGSWNVPLSRRSSMTSMDTISQISMSVDNNSEVDRLAKDLEVAQSATSDLVGQIGALQQEKAQVSQSAWATQGELQASQHQLRELQAQFAELQAKYQELDIR